MHEKEDIVPGGLQVPERVHLSAHGLRLQPDLIVAAAFHQHGAAAEIPEIQAAFFFGRVKDARQFFIFRMKGNG